jgi:solute carrier family 44 (choline transporter-like protein), member 2/4/5
LNIDIKNQTESLFNANFINTDKLISWMTDLQTCWPILLASVGFAFVVAFIYLLFVRYCAGVIAYTTILLVLAALAGLGYLFQSRIEYYQSLNDTQYELAMKVLCGLCYSLAGIWLIIILFMCERIRLAIALSEVTAEYVGKVCSVYFVPILFYILTILFYAYWVALSVFIYSSGTITKANNSLVASVEW